MRNKDNVLTIGYAVKLLIMVLTRSVSISCDFKNIPHERIANLNTTYTKVTVITGSKNKQRVCYNPNQQLKCIQQLINSKCRQLLPNNISSFSVKDIRNIVRAREYSTVLAMDIANFYPSITKDNLVKCLLDNVAKSLEDAEKKLQGKVRLPSANAKWDNLLQHKALKLKKDLSSQSYRIGLITSKLLIHDGVLPQGAPTSPIVADIFMANVDAYLRNYLNKYIPGAVYLRYVDNFYVLLPDEVNKSQVNNLINTTAASLKDIGLSLNHDKTKWMKNNQAMEILGMTALPVPEVAVTYKKAIRYKKNVDIVTVKNVKTFRTMRISNRKIEETFRYLCEVYRLHKTGQEITDATLHTAIGKVQYIVGINKKLKNGFKKIAQQLAEINNPLAKVLVRLLERPLLYVYNNKQP